MAALRLNIQEIGSRTGWRPAKAGIGFDSGYRVGNSRIGQTCKAGASQSLVPGKFFLGGGGATYV